jgi:5-methylcytosine-specific restriction endonuclease McrBC GTP-binding regulatory subunit McrB
MIQEKRFCIFVFILDEMNVQTEEIVFQSFLSWINYDSKRQTDRLAQLFALIKLPLIDKKVCSIIIFN